MTYRIYDQCKAHISVTDSLRRRLELENAKMRGEDILSATRPTLEIPKPEAQQLSSPNFPPILPVPATQCQILI
jgi:hypothetical protein